jgi:hypothetical protein
VYGYQIPRYVREYLVDWRHYDRLLRVRWSLDHPGRFILERKTRYITEHPFRYGTDAQVQYNDGYRMVFVFDPRDIRYVRGSLELTDLQRLGGAKVHSARLLAAEAKELELMDRARVAEFEAIASDHYDRLAWAEQRRISMSRTEN